MRPAERARAGGVLEPGGTCSGVGGHSTAWLPTSGLPISGLWEEELPAGGGAKLAERSGVAAIFLACVNLLSETQILDKSENSHKDCTSTTLRGIRHLSREQFQIVLTDKTAVEAEERLSRPGLVGDRAEGPEGVGGVEPDAGRLQAEHVGGPPRR